MAKIKKKAPHTKKQLVESPDLLYNDSQWRWQDIPNEPETCNASLDAKEWIVNLINEMSDNRITRTEVITTIGAVIDYELMLPSKVIEELGENVVDGYMWSPTALINGTTLVALSQGIVGIKEFIDTVDHLHQIGKKVYLYCIHKTHSAEWPLKVRYAII